MDTQNMPATPERDDRLKLLQHYHHVAVVGISADPARPSHAVALYMQAAGYTIIPINPRYAGQTLLGRPVYASLTAAQEAGEQIEVVDVFRRVQDIPPIADEAIAIGAKALWVQLGLTSEEAAQKATAAGLLYVEDLCIKVEHARFFGDLHTIGPNIGVIPAQKIAAE